MNHFACTTSYGLMSQLTKMKLFSPHIYCVTNREDRRLGPPRALVYIDPSQPARSEAIQSDLQGPRQAIVDYCNLKLFPSPDSSPCYTTTAETIETYPNTTFFRLLFLVMYIVPKYTEYGRVLPHTPCLRIRPPSILLHVSHLRT